MLGRRPKNRKYVKIKMWVYKTDLLRLSVRTAAQSGFGIPVVFLQRFIKLGHDLKLASRAIFQNQ